MSDEKQESTLKDQVVTPNKEGKITSVSVEKILSTYPIDRDKCRDVVMIEISRNLAKISTSLEGIAQGLIVVNTHLTEMNSLKKMYEK